MPHQSYKFVYSIALYLIIGSLSAMEQPKSEGLEVFTGPMFAGKTTSLIDRILSARQQQQAAIMFKFNPTLNKENPWNSTLITSHGGEQIDGFEVLRSATIRNLLKDLQFDLVCIDEAQFADETIFSLIQELLGKKTSLIIAGLFFDFRNKPFGKMPRITVMARNIAQFIATCAQCKEDAAYSQRLVNGQPATSDDPTIVLEGENVKVTYEPRCANCYKQPG